MSSEKPTVVITGLGVVGPLGLSATESWHAAVAGKSGIHSIDTFNPDDFGLKSGISGAVRGLDPESYMSPKDAKRLDRVSHLAIAAAAQAMEDSGLTVTDANRRFIGCLIATGLGGVGSLVAQAEVLAKSGARRVNPHTIPMMMPNAPSGVVSIRFGTQGPAYSVSSACASATDGIGFALDLIRNGRAKAMIVGGSEAALIPVVMAGFEQAHAVCVTSNDDPEGASRPFDLNRSGFVMAEGAAVLILEEESLARARGARIYAELAGYGVSSDAYHITAPDPEGRGAVAAMHGAVADAGAGLEDVVYINAHGTSTQMNDKIESLAIRTAFGDAAASIPVSSTKSMTGHLGGAAGAIEAFFATKAAETGQAPPTINYETPDPECTLDYIPGTARTIKPGLILSNSLGFGGHNSCLAVRSVRG